MIRPGNINRIIVVIKCLDFVYIGLPLGFVENIAFDDAFVMVVNRQTRMNDFANDQSLIRLHLIPEFAGKLKTKVSTEA